MAPEEKDIILTVGSRCRVKSIESREKPQISHGTFRGYVAIGRDEALCIELDDSHGEQAGRIRLIPTHMIVAVDVLEAVSGPEKREDVERMFG
jgi:hypothetical protein